MDSLNASAKLRWKGYHGRIEGTSGSLDVATATQVELGGPGGESNPEELFAAALANCFTSTLTGMARARGIPLGEIETAVRTDPVVGRRDAPPPVRRDAAHAGRVARARGADPRR